MKSRRRSALPLDPRVHATDTAARDSPGRNKVGHVFRVSPLRLGLERCLVVRGAISRWLERAMLGAQPRIGRAAAARRHANLIGVQEGPIERWLPVMMFAIVFGLSMNYEVFLISSIHEEWTHTRNAKLDVGAGVGSPDG